MRRYTHKFTVPTDLSRVAAFHHDARALKRLTPPPVMVQMHKVEPLAEGSLAEFTMWMGPFPVRWLAVHKNVDSQSGFTDIQEKGPFSYWQHVHSFRSVSPFKTEVCDEVTAQPGNGLYHGLMSRIMWFSLPVLFAYRAWVTRRVLSKP